MVDTNRNIIINFLDPFYQVKRNVNRSITSCKSTKSVVGVSFNPLCTEVKEESCHLLSDYYQVDEKASPSHRFNPSAALGSVPYFNLK